jgi:hypothetical protein
VDAPGVGEIDNLHGRTFRCDVTLNVEWAKSGRVTVSPA